MLVVIIIIINVGVGFVFLDKVAAVVIIVAFAATTMTTAVIPVASLTKAVSYVLEENVPNKLQLAILNSNRTLFT